MPGNPFQMMPPQMGADPSVGAMPHQPPFQGETYMGAPGGQGAMSDADRMQMMRDMFGGGPARMPGTGQQSDADSFLGRLPPTGIYHGLPGGMVPNDAELNPQGVGSGGQGVMSDMDMQNIMRALQGR